MFGGAVVAPFVVPTNDILWVTRSPRVDTPRIVSALADQSFEFPSATFFSDLESKYGLAMVQSVKRVVNILALPFTAQTSMKVMAAQAV